MACTLGLGEVGLSQSGGPVVEAPERAQKLLSYATKMEFDAKAAVTAGRLHAPADVRQALPGGDPNAERLIDERSRANNGIYVDQPKVYDDALLQQMLGSAQSQLQGLQGFDQGTLTRSLGAITGANQQTSGFGVSGGVEPPIVTTATQTTQSPFALPPAAAPAPTTTLPTSQAPSASDVLNEQLQITSQIANLRLLLEGSLSDQIMNGAHETFTKPRVTMGFPVVITPARRYRNAVAVVEVFAETSRTNDASVGGEPPSITALLPQEKTYNVASISDKSLSLGTGIASGLAGVSGTFLWGHKQYFIVKDQDTLGVQFEPSEAEKALLAGKGVDTQRLRAFSWQFRPVLGRQFVEAGSRQVFVQLAFPGRDSASVKSFGQIRVRTYWRRVDPRTGVLREVVAGSLEENVVKPIPNYDVRPDYGAVAAFNSSWMEDLGTGRMLIKLEGRLLPGTYLRVGASIIQPGANGLPADLKTTRFVASLADLATLKTFVIARDGTEYPLKIPRGTGNNFSVDRAHVRVSELDNGTALLQVPIRNFDATQDVAPALVIGGQVYGYSDAPIERECPRNTNSCVLSVTLPAAVLAANPLVRVTALMVDDDGIEPGSRAFNLFPEKLEQEKLVFLTQDKDSATYLLFGHNLTELEVVWPPASSGAQVLTTTGADSPKLLKLPLGFAKQSSTLILKRSVGQPFMVGLSAPPASEVSATAAAAETKNAPKFQERIVMGTDEATITGGAVSSIQAVLFNGKKLNTELTANGLKVKGLVAAGISTAPTTHEITLVTPAGTSTIPLEVVTGKVEVIQK